MKHLALRVLTGFAFLVAGPLLVLLFGPVSLSADWKTASQRSTGLAPDPANHPEAIVQVYASRAFAWRGAFGVHTWLVAKDAGAARYTRYEVTAWNLLDGPSAVLVSNSYAPDAEWFGAAPRVIAALSGLEAEAVIGRLPQLVADYPDGGQYRAWPGPNSNTFIAYLGRASPELALVMPPNAIGKDYLPGNRLIAESPSGTGYQISLWGLFGLLLARGEGLELNLLGLVIGVTPQAPALKLPGIGLVPFAL